MKNKTNPFKFQVKKNNQLTVGKESLNAKKETNCHVFFVEKSSIFEFKIFLKWR